MFSLFVFDRTQNRPTPHHQATLCYLLNKYFMQFANQEALLPDRHNFRLVTFRDNMNLSMFHLPSPYIWRSEGYVL
jgi:hypothetical protein